MKIALKYGLLITAVLVAWVVIVRFVLNVRADSAANVIAPILFNLTTIVSIYLGMQARKRELGGDLKFKEGIKTGMGISLVYAISSCLFFVIQFLVSGPELLMSEGGPDPGPPWRVAAFAFGGLFFLSIFFGLIYSTIISFFIARRQGRESSEII